MTVYEISYIRTGSGEKQTLDRVQLNTNDSYEFEGETVIPTNITEIIEVFEMIAEKWWGTYENRNAIREIKVLKEW